MKTTTQTPVRMNPFAKVVPVCTSGDRSSASKLPSKVIITRK